MKRLGIEIEFTGVKREEVVRALENLFHSEAEQVYNSKVDIPYSYYRVKDFYGNTWVIVRDRSIKSQVYSSESRFGVVDVEDADHEYACELVSPVLDSTTLPVLFTVVDVIKSIGGITNKTCGIHIHIDKPDIETTIQLFRKFLVMQDEIFDRFNVQANRQFEYCKKFSPSTVVPDFKSEIEFIDWYHNNFSYVENGQIQPKTSRYYGLNLHSIVAHNTIEFRIFNSSLDCYDIASYIKFVLSFCYVFDDISSYSLMLERYLLRELERKSEANAS